MMVEGNGKIRRLYLNSVPKKIVNKKQYLLYTEAESSLNGLTVTNEVSSVLSFLPKQLLASLFAYRTMICWMVHVSHGTYEERAANLGHCCLLKIRLTQVHRQFSEPNRKETSLKPTLRNYDTF